MLMACVCSQGVMTGPGEEGLQGPQKVLAAAVCLCRVSERPHDPSQTPWPNRTAVCSNAESNAVKLVRSRQHNPSERAAEYAPWPLSTRVRLSGDSLSPCSPGHYHRIKTMPYFRSLYSMHYWMRYCATWNDPKCAKILLTRLLMPDSF